MVTAAKKNKDLICNPILTFTEKDVWRYIKENDIEVNPLYEMGYRRVGCIGCPLGGRKNQVKEFKDFPKHKQAYIKAFGRMLDKRNEIGLKVGWKTGEEVFDWWIGQDAKNVEGQITMDEYIDQVLTSV